jgi:hypothetical protein
MIWVYRCLDLPDMTVVRRNWDAMKATVVRRKPDAMKHCPGW